MATTYLGERDGPRVLAYGDAATQVGDDFQATLETWEVLPLGEVGDVLFRSIDFAANVTGGYALGITPIVDGVALTEQTFSGATSGEIQCQAFFATRGTRCAARVRTLSRPGTMRIANLRVAFVPIREVP